MDEGLNNVALGTIPCEMSVFTSRRQDLDPATINWTIPASLSSQPCQSIRKSMLSPHSRCGTPASRSLKLSVITGWARSLIMSKPTKVISTSLKSRWHPVSAGVSYRMTISSPLRCEHKLIYRMELVAVTISCRMWLILVPRQGRLVAKTRS